MAEKILNTRIALKIDTLENWEKSTIGLKKGELAIATVAATAGTGLEEPVCMIKIGEDGVKTFKDLEWNFYAKAADVVAACKSETSLRAFVNGVIADAGIATDEALTALAGKVTTAEGKITTLEGQMTAVEGKASANETAIGVLNGLVGDSKVVDQINSAIAELKLAETYAAKSIEKTVADHVADTVSHVTTSDKTTWNAALQAADVTVGGANGTISVKGADVAVKGLGSAAFTESTAYDAAGSASSAETAAKAYAKEYADGLAKNYDAAGSAAAAQAAAEAYADGLAGNYDAAGAASAAETAAKKYTDEEIAEWVGDKSVAAQIEDLKLSENYDAKGAAAAAESAAKTHATNLNTAMNTRVEALEAIDHDHENKGVLDGITATKVAAWDAAEKNAKDYADALDEDMDERVQALEAKFGEGEGNVESQIAAAVAGEAALREAADGELQKAIDAIEADYLTSVEEKALQDQIDAIDGVIGDVTSIAEYVSGAVDAEAEIARAAEKANADAIKAIKDDYLKASDKTELTGAIATAKQEAIATVLGEGTDEDFDTLKEIADWILSDTTGAAALQTDVATIKADYLKAADKTELEGKITAAQNAADKAQGEVDALEEVVATKAAASDVTALTGRVSTAEGKITTLEGEMDDAQEAIIDLGELIGDGGSVQAQISKAIEEENLSQYAKAADLNTANGKISTLEGKAHTHANADELAKFVDGDKAKLDAAVQSVTPGTGLTATKTGTDIAIGFDENCVFIFDCGDAEVE